MFQRTSRQGEGARFKAVTKESAVCLRFSILHSLTEARGFQGMTHVTAPFTADNTEAERPHPETGSGNAERMAHQCSTQV